MTGKNEMVMQKLRDGWSDVPTLMQETGWQAHTLRAAICVMSKKQGLKIERRREDGVTSYRVAEQ